MYYDFSGVRNKKDLFCAKANLQDIYLLKHLEHYYYNTTLSYCLKLLSQLISLL